MPPKRKRKKSSKEDIELVGVDSDLGLYELTDLFYSYYRYHNDNNFLEYDHITSIDPAEGTIQSERRNLSRFDTFRRLEICRLGSRPFLGGKGIAIHRPNVSMGYLSWFLEYLTLPYKSVFTDSDFVKVFVNKSLYDQEMLTPDEQEALRIQAANNPSLTSNAETSDDVSDAFINILRLSKKFSKCTEVLPLRLAQDGVIAFVHNDMDWVPDPVFAIDLVTEPQAEFDATNWNSFFVIRKMTAQEAVGHIRSPGKFWNKDALRWSLESAVNNNALIGGRHYNSYSSANDDNVCDENYMVKSYMADKSDRRTNIGSYYGNMLVVEAYYQNAKGKIDKTIFFPSKEFVNVSKDERARRIRLLSGVLSKDDKLSGDRQLKRSLKEADVLFYRENVYDTMEEAITVIPFDRAEPTIERQRAYGHELFHPLEIAGRLDTAIFNFAILMGVPFYKNRAEGTDGQDIGDIEMMVNGEMQDLGERDFVETPFQADLNGMLGVRRILLQHAASKAFLGGLDGAETNSNGRGAQLANLRLVRDGRVHKHTGENLAAGLKPMFSKIFKSVLDLNNKGLVDDDVLVQKLFFDVLTNVQGYSDDLFEFDKKDIIPDTGLPYWMNIEALRNGASHFGAGEVVILTEIMNMFGNALDQRSMQALQRRGVKNLMSAQDALDIFGDPKEQMVTDQDQVYQATLESGAIQGSVDIRNVDFKPIPIRLTKDDHVVHLSQVHNPDATKIIQRLQEGDVTPDMLQDLTEDQLDTRINLILELGAHANHISLHQQALERFGRRRDDINRLREETNAILQSTEGLLNSLQVNIRAAQQKRQERELRLRNLTPENQAEQMKQQTELEKLALEERKSQRQLLIANNIAASKDKQHIDKQVSKSRDRELKRQIADSNARIKEQEVNIQQAEAANSILDSRVNGTGFGGG